MPRSILLKSLFGAIGLALLCLGSSSAFADHGFDTMPLRGGYFNLSDGQTYTLDLGNWYHVKKLFIRAQAYRSDAVFEVIANGDVKGTVHVPGRDPSYVVTIGETVRSLQFRHIMGERVTVSDVTAVLSDWSQRDWDPRRYEGEISRPARNLSMQIANEAIALVERIDYHTDPQDFLTYLLPIRTAAGRVYAMGNARGDLSYRVREALCCLRAQLDFASFFLDCAFRRNSTFDLAVQLLSLREKIDDLLD